MANQTKPDPIKLEIKTGVEIDPVKLAMLKNNYEKAGGAVKERAFEALRAYKNELYQRIDGELLAYGNIAKRQVDTHFGV